MTRPHLKSPEPLLVGDRFTPLLSELLSLLRSLEEDDWGRSTAAGRWTVKDVAAHLLDGDLRRLSFQRDRHPVPAPPFPVENPADLVAFLDRLNAEWVVAARRMSPRLLVELLAVTGEEVARLFRDLDPMGPALFSVAWAGEDASLSWFDVAREYTEKWHHQQQIRDAVGAPGLLGREWLGPVLNTFFRALPHVYRAVPADDGAQVVVEVSGEAGGDWTLVREGGAWRLYEGRGDEPTAIASMSEDSAWRLMTKGLRRDEAVSRVTLEGDARLGEPMLSAIAIMG